MFLPGLLFGLATANVGPTPLRGDASGSDSVNACIDLDWRSKDAALPATTGFEAVAGGTSQACSAGRITSTDVQRKICDRGCPGGPHKTFSTFSSCRMIFRLSRSFIGCSRSLPRLALSDLSVSSFSWDSVFKIGLGSKHIGHTLAPFVLAHFLHALWYAASTVLFLHLQQLDGFVKGLYLRCSFFRSILP